MLNTAKYYKILHKYCNLWCHKETDIHTTSTNWMMDNIIRKWYCWLCVFKITNKRTVLNISHLIIYIVINNATNLKRNNLEMRLNPFREIKRIQREIDFMESSDFDTTYKLQFPLVPLFMVSMSRLYSTFLFLQYVYYTFKNDRIKLMKAKT